MDIDARTAWCAALRSDEFTQCQRVLHDGKGYCCLGVFLKKVVGLVLVEVDTIGHASFGVLNHSWYRGDSSPTANHVNTISLPAWVREKYRIAMHDMHHLTTLNDEKNYTFREIADWIEGNM